MFMIMFVLDNPSHLDEILEAWSKVGLPGATIMESTGLNRRNVKLTRTRRTSLPEI